jgi:hypothetical protein
MWNAYIYALINQVFRITNNECLTLYHKAFRADYISRSSIPSRMPAFCHKSSNIDIVVKGW